MRNWRRLWCPKCRRTVLEQLNFRIVTCDFHSDMVVVHRQNDGKTDLYPTTIVMNHVLFSVLGVAAISGVFILALVYIHASGHS